jgi:hypothetical protein
MLTTDFSLPDMIRSWQSDHLDLMSSGRSGSSLILSLNPLFCGKHDSKLGKTTQTNIMKVPRPIEEILIAYTKFYHYFYVCIFLP